MRYLIISSTLTLAACGSDTATVALATRADSAGIEFVTNAEPSWQGEDGWQVDPVPTIEIGPRPDDDPRYDLLRVSSGTVLPNGEIVLLAGGSREIRFFSAQGEWLRTASRDGEGPGEMRNPAGLSRTGDTLFLRDFQLSRLSAFSTSGEFLTSWPYLNVEERGRIMPNQRLADGSWIGSAGLSFGGGSMPAQGLSRHPVGYFRLAADMTAVLDSVVTTPGSEMVVNIMTGEGGAIRGMSVSPPPLGRTAPVAAAGDRIIWGDNANPEIRILTANGTLQSIVRWEAPATPVDAALIERIKQEALSRSDGSDRSREGIESRYGVPSPAPVVPWFNGVQIDSEGAIWLREFTPLVADSVRFRIFQPNGQLLGLRTFPPRTTLLEIGRDHILAVWQDDDDLEYVRVYRMRREGEP